MKRTLAVIAGMVIVALILILTPPVFASNKGLQTVADTTAKQAPTRHVGHGKVISVDKQAGKVRLAHDAITSLNWPGMTMDFKVLDKTQLNNLVPGTSVDFDVIKTDGGYYISKITPSAH